MNKQVQLRGGHCARGMVTDRQWLGPERQHAALEVMECFAAVESCRRGQRIYGPQDRVEYWYRVVSGAARNCALLANGRRQILKFLLPGDFFGFTDRDEHAFAAEAVVKGTIVMRYPRRRLRMLADSDPQLGQLIREVALEDIAHLQARMLNLGQMTALEKVGPFVIEVAERLTREESEAFMLVMSRDDIADYLALSSETVSRTMTDLRLRGATRLLGSRRVKIVNRSAPEANGGV